MSFWKNPFKSITNTVKDVIQKGGEAVGSVVGSVVGGVVSPFIDTKTQSAIQLQKAQVENQIKLDNNLLNSSVTGFGGDISQQKPPTMTSTETTSTNALTKYLPYGLGAALLSVVGLLTFKKKK